ncbi:YccF domain-containing protein [Paraburkholderia fungorum]|uniref:YccF domain-containing protein n=1 Tax=Paraburkholderia fungorum TaxID=134537 RepID=UPI0038BCF34E
MKKIGNIIWFLFLGGFWSWALWLVVALLCFVSIVGIPWGRACYNVSEFSSGPFGREAINRHQLTQKKDIGTSIFGTLGNLIWFLLIGWWMTLAHVGAGVLCCATVVLIPFGIQHFKLAGLSISPIGKSIVSHELADETRRVNARADLNEIRMGLPVADVKEYDKI